jgi:hypothetical protein
MVAPLHIVIDSREQSPWAWEPCDATTEIAGLAAGDYALREDVLLPQGNGVLRAVRFSIERKSLSDFAGTISSGWDRFLRELTKMETFPARVIIVEGDFNECCFGDTCFMREVMNIYNDNVRVFNTGCERVLTIGCLEHYSFCPFCGKKASFEEGDITMPTHGHNEVRPLFVARRISELTMMGVSVLFAGDAALASGLAYRIFKRRLETINGTAAAKGPNDNA